ncbi:FAD-dependent oxidoreductase [Amycolatopsis sp. OK19-0408]|uniref:FAD-dependent oxidoreductase n=1 Tax=Amycolatopsis iheyensis TaxID=2945988 RepID=A0A9X2NEQ2_9PSEU|nr:FAD-dependent oxidoreductase [Amycolatopsis iheyensis]MCR6487396.1 FAD-dependent oxidoreductase [Amycolatopsis iheyensis]
MVTAKQSTPVLLVVDDDPTVLSALRRDLGRYRDRYRVLAAGTPRAALEILDTLRERGAEAALLLVDQRMPEMTGTEFLAEARDRFPAAKKVLLTAYADTSVAITAINEVRLDHYLVKPWEPPEERLYPVLDDLLASWEAAYCPPYGGIRVLGHPFAPATHRVRDFLTRHQQPFRFVDVTGEDAPGAVWPRVDLPDGTWLSRPTHQELAEVLGLAAAADRPHYDTVIVGGGPTGLAAAVYGSSEGLSTLLVDAYVPGGQAGTSSRIENYLGFPSGVSGADLTRRAVAQARRFGADILAPVSAVALRAAGRARVLGLSDGREVTAGTVLLATGLAYERLTAAGAERFEGAGIYYGATTSETTACARRHVWIVGGANSAGQAALHFAEHASAVTVLVRGSDLAAGMSRYLVDEIRRHPAIDVRLDTTVVAVDGDERLRRLTLCDRRTGRVSTEDAEYLFTFIGARPRTTWLADAVTRDEHGFLLTGPDLADPPAGWDLPRRPFLLETSMPGVFAAGDARANSVKRIAAGVGEGAMAASLIHRYRADL